MTALLHALANLARLRWLGAAFCALAMLCVITHASALAGATAHAPINVNASSDTTTIASASEAAQTKTRVWGFEQNSPLHVWILRSASTETHRGTSTGLPETASASSYAAEGTALAESVQIGGEAWRVFQAGEPAIQNGCEAAAQAIQNAIGGEIRTITPSVGRFLGGVRNAAGEFVNPAGSKAVGWSSHTVVVNGGRVFDALTGPQGMAVEAYKTLFEYADVLIFGF